MAKKKITTIAILATLHISLSSCAQGTTGDTIPVEDLSQADATRTLQLEALISAIAATNEVHHRAVGISGETTPQYDRYVALADWPIADLRELTAHHSPVVRCYAGWALADKEYAGLDTVFAEFLKEKAEVNTINGCIRSTDDLSSKLYHKYWNQLWLKTYTRIEDEALEKDLLLYRMDSIVIYTDDVYWLLIERALSNRVYLARFNERIAELAFQHHDLRAAKYIHRNERGQFEEQLRTVLIHHMESPELWPSEYLDVATLVLSFQDSGLTELLLKRMRKEDNWKHSREQFSELFREYHLQLP